MACCLVRSSSTSWPSVLVPPQLAARRVKSLKEHNYHAPNNTGKHSLCWYDGWRMRVSVMPLLALLKDDKAYVSAIIKVKWNGRKLYDAEILKMLGECLLQIIRLPCSYVSVRVHPCNLCLTTFHTCPNPLTCTNYCHSSGFFLRSVEPGLRCESDDKSDLDMERQVYEKMNNRHAEETVTRQMWVNWL